MAHYKILISDPVAEICLSILQQNGLEVHLQTDLSPQQLREQISGFHGMIVRSGTRVTADIITKAENLKVIGRAGAGVDNIDVSAATRRGIAVLNAAKGNTISTAEHTFALMMALARRIPEAQISLLHGKWERSRFKGVELYGKILGIVGIGKIGREVAKRAQAFGMHVIAHDPLVDASVFKALGVEECDLDALFRRSDFVTIHVPFGKETTGLIGEKQFENCKSSLRIINASRGGVVDEAALHKALTTGKLAGAALDVFEKEPPGEHPLFRLENVVATPHLGASTKEAQVRVAEEIAHVVADFLIHKKFENIVNPEVVKE